MQLTKTLTSALAAAGLVGAIGLAYAQTSTDPAQTPPPSTTQTPPPEPATTTTPPSTMTAPPASTPASPSTDTAPLTPQADRN
jgi:hypothetical protein